MRNPRKAFRSWRNSVGTTIAVAKSKREFEKVLENRPYNIVQCEAAHKMAEHLPIELGGALSWGGTVAGLPDLDEAPEKATWVPPWLDFQIDADRAPVVSWSLGDPIDVVQRAAIKEHGQVGDTYHLVSMGSDDFPPLFVRIARSDDGTEINTSYGFLRHRNAAAQVNCIECHNYASEWLNRMVIPGSPTDKRPIKVDPLARLVIWLALAALAVRGLFLASDLADIYSHLETAIEWIDLTAGS